MGGLDKSLLPICLLLVFSLSFPSFPPSFLHNAILVLFVPSTCQFCVKRHRIVMLCCLGRCTESSCRRNSDLAALPVARDWPTDSSAVYFSASVRWGKGPTLLPTESCVKIKEDSGEERILSTLGAVYNAVVTLLSQSFHLQVTAEKRGK